MHYYILNPLNFKGFLNQCTLLASTIHCKTTVRCRRKCLISLKHTKILFSCPLVLVSEGSRNDHPLHSPFLFHSWYYRPLSHHLQPNRSQTRVLHYLVVPYVVTIANLCCHSLISCRPFIEWDVGENGTNREADEISAAHSAQEAWEPTCSLLLYTSCFPGSLVNIWTLSSHFQNDIYYYSNTTISVQLSHSSQYTHWMQN